MARGRNKAIPISPRTYPEYVYNEYPKILGKVDNPDLPGQQMTVRALNAMHEKELRQQYPSLPIFVPPPSSMTHKQHRALHEELLALRAENARLKAEKGEAVVIDPASMPQPLSVPSTGALGIPPGAQAGMLTENDIELQRLEKSEHPAGDPWAGLPENQTPEPGKPPSIKGGPKNPANKLK